VQRFRTANRARDPRTGDVALRYLYMTAEVWVSTRTLAAARRRRPGIAERLRRQRVPASDIVIHDLDSETLAVVLFALAFIGLSMVVPLLIARLPMPIWGASDYLQDFWYAVVFKIVFLLSVPLIAYRRRGYGLSDALLGWRPLPGQVLAVILAFAGGAALNLDRAAGIGRALESMPVSEGLARAAVGAVLALLMAGLPEEFVYRFLLQTRLEKRIGRVFAIVVTALLFTAWHMPPRLALSHGVEGEAGNLASVLVGTGAPVLVIALVLGLAWDRWRNLPALVAVHWGVDLLPIVSSMLQVPPK